MSFYFHISTGLRGCYMPDNVYCVRVETRRELRDVIAEEAENYRLSGYVGASRAKVASVAADAWRARRKAQLPYALPVAPPHARKNYCEAVFVSSATRDEWKKSQEADQF